MKKSFVWKASVMLLLSGIAYITHAETVYFRASGYDIQCMGDTQPNSSRTNGLPFIGCSVNEIGHKYKRDKNFVLD